MKAHKPKLSLTDYEYRYIADFVVTKFAFDEMFLPYATTKENIELIESSLLEAEYLFKKLETHPTSISEPMAKRLVAFLIDAQLAYRSSIDILKRLGYRDTSPFEAELKKAERLHQTLNEFLIDCLEN